MQIQVMTRKKKSTTKNADSRRGAKRPEKILPYKAVGSTHVLSPELARAFGDPEVLEDYKLTCSPWVGQHNRAGDSTGGEDRFLTT